MFGNIWFVIIWRRMEGEGRERCLIFIVNEEVFYRDFLINNVRLKIKK